MFLYFSFGLAQASQGCAEMRKANHLKVRS
jgi:hypothetical protein